MSRAIAGPTARWSAAVAAAVWLSAGVAIAPASAQISVDAIAACSQDRQPAKAVEACTRMLDGSSLSDQMRATVMHLRGVAHQGAGDTGAALRDFVGARKLDPKQAGAIASFVLALDDLNRRCFRETAEATIVQGCTALIDNAAVAEIEAAALARAHMARATALERQGKAAEARADFARALERRSDLDATLVARAELALAPSHPPEPSQTISLGATQPATAAAAAATAAPASDATLQAPRAGVAAAAAAPRAGLRPAERIVLDVGKLTARPQAVAKRAAPRAVRIASYRRSSACR